MMHQNILLRLCLFWWKLIYTTKGYQNHIRSQNRHKPTFKFAVKIILCNHNHAIPWNRNLLMIGYRCTMSKKNVPSIIQRILSKEIVWFSKHTIWAFQSFRKHALTRNLLLAISKLPLVVLGSIEAQYYPIHSFVLRQYWEHQCSIELTNVVLKLYWSRQCCIETTICCIDITKCCIDTTFAVLKSPQWYWHNHCSIEIITVVLKTSLQYWKYCFSIAVYWNHQMLYWNHQMLYWHHGCSIEICSIRQ